MNEALNHGIVGVCKDEHLGSLEDEHNLCISNASSNHSTLDMKSGEDELFKGLIARLDSAKSQVEDIVRELKSSLLYYLESKKLQEDINGIVVGAYVRSSQEQISNARSLQSYSNSKAKWWRLKMKEISCLRQKLDSIARSLPILEGSPEKQKCSTWAKCGDSDEIMATILKNLSSDQVKNMPREAFVCFVNGEITKMKRHYDTRMQQMTEQYFTCQREMWKGKGALPKHKDKEIDLLQKQIMEAVLVLDNVLTEDEKPQRCKSLDEEDEVELLSKWVSDSKENLSEIYENVNCSSEKSEVEDDNLGSLFNLKIYEAILKEYMSEAKEKFVNLNRKYVDEMEMRSRLEVEALEREANLRSSNVEKERLESKVSLLVEKEKLAEKIEKNLEEERERSMLASQELNNLRSQLQQYQVEISKLKAKAKATNGKLVEALKEIELCQGKNCRLKEKFKQVSSKLGVIFEEKAIVLVALQEKEKALSLFEATEREKKKLIVSIVVLLRALSSDAMNFKDIADEAINLNNLRLKKLSCQLSFLVDKANKLGCASTLSKQMLKQMDSNLKKAEAEVDALGDEVDALHTLLRKIHTGLDHYSPILQHYPKIAEVVKLVKKELDGKSPKPI